MTIRRIIPNSLTCCNLLCGAAAVFAVTQDWYTLALLLMIGGALFDFFDGLSARALHAPSPIGVELDSLADDITFGLAPAMALFCYLRPMIGWWSVIALLMAAFAALRLAKFNIDTRQTSSFIGLATPPNAIFWGSICCIPHEVMNATWAPWGLLGLSLISCYLLVSEIPFFSLKFHHLRWHENEAKWLFLIGMIVILIFSIMRALHCAHLEMAFLCGAAIVVWYVLLNAVYQVLTHKDKK